MAVQERTLVLGSGLDLRYTIATPGDPMSGRPLPLVLALHYGWNQGGRPPRFYSGAFLAGLIAPALAQLGALLVAPDCPGQDWSEPESEAATLSFLEHIATDYAIDRRRVLVTGYSLGGMGTWHLAGRHPDLFSAALPISGWPPEGAVERIAVPLYVIHSQDDELIPLDPTAAAVHALRARGAAVAFVAAAGITHFEVPRFAPHLRAAVPWIQGVWQDR